MKGHWAVALQQLIEILEDALEKGGKRIQRLIQSQLTQWVSDLPNYIKAYMPVLSCES